MILLQTVLTLCLIKQATYGPLVFVVTFVWGLQDSIVNTHMSELLGFEFLPDNVRPYSVFNIVQSITIFSFLGVEAFVDTPTEMYLFHTFCGLFGLAMCLALLKFPFKSKHHMSNTNTNTNASQQQQHHNHLGAAAEMNEREECSI